MKRITVLILIVSVFASVSCSTRKKYSEIREFISEVVSAQEEFLSMVDKSANADEMVSAIDTFSNKLDMLAAKSMEIKKRYPDIDKYLVNPPEELAADFGKLENIESRFGKVFIKENVKAIVKDNKVQAAFIGLTKKTGVLKFF